MAILALWLMLNAGCSSTGKEFAVKEGEDIIWHKAGEHVDFIAKVDSATVSRRYWKFKVEKCE